MGNEQAAAERAMSAQAGFLDGQGIRRAQAMQHEAEAAHRAFGGAQLARLAGNQLRLQAAPGQQGSATLKKLDFVIRSNADEMRINDTAGGEQRTDAAFAQLQAHAIQIKPDARQKVGAGAPANRQAQGQPAAAADETHAVAARQARQRQYPGFRFLIEPGQGAPHGDGQGAGMVVAQRCVFERKYHVDHQP